MSDDFLEDLEICTLGITEIQFSHYGTEELYGYEWSDLFSLVS